MTQTDGKICHILGLKATQGRIQIQCDPYQNNGIFCRMRRKSLKICVEMQKTQVAKAIFREKNGGVGIRLLDFSLYYEATVVV